MGTISKAMSNTFYLFLDWLTQTALGYLFWIVLAKLLLPEQVGAFSTILNLALFIVGFSILGLSGAATKLLSEYQAKNQIKKIRTTTFYTLKISLVANLILILSIFFLSPYLAQFGYLSEIEIQSVGFVLFAIYLLYLSGAYIYALQKMRKLFLTNTGFALSKLVITVFLIFLGFNYFGAIAGIIISALIFSITRLKWVPIGKGKTDKKRIWFYAIPGLIGGIGSILINQGNILALSILSDMSAVGIFTIAFMFSTPIRVIPQTIATALFPITSQQWALKEKMIMNKTVTQVLKYSYLFAIPIMFTFLIFAREVLILFTSHKYLEGILPIQILSIAYLFFGLSYILIGILYFTGKPNTNRNINLATGFANILLCILLIPFFGIIGAALAFLISSLIMFSSSFYYSYKHLRFSIAKKQHIKNIFASLLFVSILYLFRQIDTSIFTIIIAAITASVVYLLSLLYLRFFDEIDLKVLREFDTKTPNKFKFLIQYAERILEKFVK